MESHKKYIDYLIKKYLSGQASAKEEKILIDFFESRIESSEWNELEMGDKTEVYKTLKEKIHHRIYRSNSHKFHWVKYAAAVFIIALIGLSIFLKNSSQKLKLVESGAKVDSVKLADGSLVVMSPNSQIEFPTTFNEKIREVNLISGNAFFKVIKDSLKPFVVSSQSIKTTVLGTSFNINLKKTKVEVVVKTGKVKVSMDDENFILLLPDEAAVYDRHEKKLNKTKEVFIPWFVKTVEIDRVKLKDIVPLIELRYGYKMHFEEPEFAEQIITINLTTEDNIDSVIDQLNFISKLKFKKQANEIVVSKK